VDIFQHVLSGKVTHTGTKHIWQGKIKIPTLEFTSLLETFLKKEHDYFLESNRIVVEGFRVLREQGVEWWGSRSIRVFVKNALSDISISEDTKYGRRLALYLKQKITKDLGDIPVEITARGIMKDLTNLNVMLKDGSSPEYLEFSFEIDLQANPI